MALILGVDTSAKPVSCALVQDDRVLASFFANTGLTHSQTLMPMVENLLNVSGKTVADLDAIAVNAGPGSFTGVRIGVSAVKGLAFTHTLPCISVSTLEAMAENVKIAPQSVICCLMDARCHQVYGALFRVDDGGELHRLTDDDAVTVEQMGERIAALNQSVVLVGDGSEMCYNEWRDTLSCVSLAPPTVRYQNAAATALIGARRFCEGAVVSEEELLPTYLRLPQAERELNARLNNK